MAALLGEAFGGFAPRPLVLLNPNASDMLPLRKWETGRFVELGKRLLAADNRMGIVVTGAPSEAESAAMWPDSSHRRGWSVWQAKPPFESFWSFTAWRMFSLPTTAVRVISLP